MNYQFNQDYPQQQPQMMPQQKQFNHILAKYSP